MSFTDYFNDWEISAIPRNYTSAPDPDTGEWIDEVPVDGDAISGVKYNRSAAERYFSQTWAEDVAEVFVTGDIGTATKTGKLVIDSVEWSIDSIIDVGELGEVFVIGLKVIQ